MKFMLISVFLLFCCFSSATEGGGEKQVDSYIYCIHPDTKARLEKLNFSKTQDETEAKVVDIVGLFRRKESVEDNPPLFIYEKSNNRLCRFYFSAIQRDVSDEELCEKYYMIYGACPQEE